MAKKALSFIDLVTGADTDTLRAALEARSKIDELLVLRHEAYRKIAELEDQVNNVVGDEGTFEFDAPEFDVAFGGKSPKKKAPAKAKATDASASKEEEEIPTEELEYVSEDSEESSNTKDKAK